MSTAPENREIKKRLPRWLRIFLWVEAIMGVFVLAAAFADSPAQQLRNALIIGAVTYGLYRWLRKRRGRHVRQKIESAEVEAKLALMKCSICSRTLNNSNDPLSGDCGGDCWGCIGELEAKTGWEPSLTMVRREFASGLRPGWRDPESTASHAKAEDHDKEA